MSDKSKKTNKEAKETKSKDKEEVIEEIFVSPDHVRPSRISSAVVLSIFAAVFFGLLSGFIGFAFVISGAASNFPFLKDFDILNILPEKQIVIRQQQYVTVTEDEYVRDVLDKISSNIAVLVRDDEDLDNNDVISYGYVVSSDGWIVFPDILENIEKDVEVIIGNIKYIPEEYTYSQQIRSTFVKVQASNLNPVSFTDKNDINRSNDYFVVYKNFPSGQIIQSRAYIKGMIEEDNYEDNQIDKKYIISFDGKAEIPQILYFNDTVAGFVFYDDERKENYLYPSYYITRLLKQVFEKQEVDIPYLGVKWRPVYNYYDSEVKKIQIDYGAEVIDIDKEGPAYESGIRKGDVILKIDDVPLDGEYTLSEIILSKDYDEGIFINFIDKEGKENEVLVKLRPAEVTE